jgi:hypothetical protein
MFNWLFGDNSENDKTSPDFSESGLAEKKVEVESKIEKLNTEIEHEKSLLNSIEFLQKYPSKDN